MHTASFAVRLSKKFQRRRDNGQPFPEIFERLSTWTPDVSSGTADDGRQEGERSGCTHRAPVRIVTAPNVFTGALALLEGETTFERRHRRETASRHDLAMLTIERGIRGILN